MKESKKWYDRNGIMFLWFFLFWPVFVIGLWKRRSTSKWVKIFFTLFFGFLLYIVITDDSAEIAKQKAIKEQAVKEKNEQARRDSLLFYKRFVIDAVASKKYKTALLYIDSSLIVAKGGEVDTLIQLRADSYYKIKNYASAIKDYTTLIANNKRLSYSYYNRALCFKKQKEYQLAVDDLRIAIKKGNVDAEKLHDKINPIKKRISYYTTLCCDGSTSSAKGRGACSHHGGVCDWNHAVYEKYREY